MTGSEPGDAPPESRLHRRPPPPIPVILLTGFLGAGKTTLLNRLVQSPDFAGAVVIVNEFGEVAVDHLLVEGAEGGLLTLSSGCICCTVRGDLVDMLEDLLRRRDNNRMPPFTRVVIETTGLAEPGPILTALAQHPYLGLRFAVGGIVTVVDSLHGLATLSAHHEAQEQAAMADVLVLTKGDMPGADVSATRARVSALAPAAVVLDAAAGEATAGAILAAAGRPGGREPAPAHDHHHHHHHDNIGTVVLRATVPLDPAAAEMALTLLRANHGPSLLRFKGLLALRDDPARPLLVQGVQGTLHPLRRLDRWPDKDRTSRLVVIAKPLDRAAVEGLWAAFFGPPAVDRPDAAALLADRREGPGLF